MGRSLRVYLCGGIKKDWSDESSSFWTPADIRVLSSTALPLNLVVLDPADRNDDLTDVRATFGRDLLQVFSSDAVIVDARTKRGLGVGAELLFAKSRHIPVIAIVPPVSHYQRSNVSLMGQPVRQWLHPFVSELSDVVVPTVADAAMAAVDLSEGRVPVRGPESFEAAMLHYLRTQSGREPDMVCLLIRDDGVPSRVAEAFGHLTHC